MSHLPKWRCVGAVAELEKKGRLSVVIGEIHVGIFRVESGVYAIDDICPHAYGKLSSGYVKGESVECPLHNAVFNLQTGRCQFGGAWELKKYDVHVKGDGSVYIRI